MVKKLVKALLILTWLLGAGVVSLACFYLWPSKESTMPAWIQAIGSVGAILVAVYVMDTQHRRLQKEKTLTDSTERANLIAAAIMFAIESRKLGEALLESADGGRLDRTFSKGIEGQLRRALQAVEQIPFWRTSLEESRDITLVISACRALVANIESTDEGAHRDFVRGGGVGEEETFPISTLAELLPEFVESVSRNQSNLSEKYVRLMGDLRG